MENTAALVRLAGREHRLGGRYADLSAGLAAGAVGAPRGLGGEALAALLDRLGVRRRLPKSFSALESDARVAASAPRRRRRRPRTSIRWRREMTGEAA